MIHVTTRTPDKVLEIKDFYAKDKNKALKYANEVVTDTVLVEVSYTKNRMPKDFTIASESLPNISNKSFLDTKYEYIFKRGTIFKVL